jgi:hypothetical protein
MITLWLTFSPPTQPSCHVGMVMELEGLYLRIWELKRETDQSLLSVPGFRTQGALSAQLEHRISFSSHQVKFCVYICYCILAICPESCWFHPRKPGNEYKSWESSFFNFLCSAVGLLLLGPACTHASHWHQMESLRWPSCPGCLMSLAAAGLHLIRSLWSTSEG